MNENRRNRIRFVICLADDLPNVQARKIYRVLPDAKAEAINWIRVVDDSEEDYLYPAADFVFISLPKEAHRLIVTAKNSRRKVAKASTLGVAGRKRPAART